MKIVLVNTQAPFVRGGAEYLVESLKAKLQERSHEVCVVNVPFKWYPPDNIPKHILACRLLRLDAIEPDLVISHKFPSYFVPFPRKKLWLFHQFRQVYELWGTPYQDIPATPEGERIREMIIHADNTYLREAKEIYTNSKTVANRLKAFNDIEADAVLYPPLLKPEMFCCGECGNYFFYPSRITRSKRQAMAIQAMRYVKSDFKLLLAGKADSPSYERELEQVIARFGLHNKVKLLGWISEEEKARLMANAYAALYLPYDEDSYGFVTLEAFYSSKPVLTFKDSGGIHEILINGSNGLILEPTAQALAEGMELLWSQREKAIEMGKNAFQSLRIHNINWDYVLDNLLS